MQPLEDPSTCGRNHHFDGLAVTGWILPSPEGEFSAPFGQFPMEKMVGEPPVLSSVALMNERIPCLIPRFGIWSCLRQVKLFLAHRPLASNKKSDQFITTDGHRTRDTEEVAAPRDEALSALPIQSQQK